MASTEIAYGQYWDSVGTAKTLWLALATLAVPQRSVPRRRKRGRPTAEEARRRKHDQPGMTLRARYAISDTGVWYCLAVRRLAICGADMALCFRMRYAVLVCGAMRCAVLSEGMVLLPEGVAGNDCWHPMHSNLRVAS
eukprot:3109594-Rhodomonas_salina.2